MSTLAVAEVRAPLAVASARFRRALPMLALLGQLALALLVIREFRLESRTFFQVAVLAGVAAIPHAFLPLAWRMPAFLAVSAAALALVVGVADAAWIAAVGVALVGLCHLPIRPWARIALLVAAAGALAAARAGYVAVPWSGLAWAALGSMMMFRLALYFHAVRHEPKRPTPLQAAAYFLMVPNPVFPLFPVVDYTTFVRSHYARDAMEIYQTGMLWIARGLVHLLLYRVVYQFLPADPLALSGLGELLWYVLGTFLLYLRVSGQFHLIIGMLRLYGFDLPETHKLFFLSSSFTDFWRRINIYWKDFMMKLVYYPSFFRLRKHGGTTALVGATVVVFVVTWFLHGYQWFWLLGSFPKSIPDVLFWTILGALVVVTSLREAKRGRNRALGAQRWSLSLATRTLATFCALAVLWSLWSAESVIEWAWMWRAAGRVDAIGVAMLAALVLGGLAIGGRNWSAPAMLTGARPSFWRRPEFRTAATLVVLLVAARPEVTSRLGPVAPLLAATRQTTLNERDAAVERRGYYERLDHAPRLGAQGWEARGQRPAGWQGLPATGASRARDDFALAELVPNVRVEFMSKTLTTNEWGMRDAPRALAKPAGTVRLALLGPSFVMGSGVADDETYAAQLERRLNATLGPGGRRYEALNFGRPAEATTQTIATLDERVWRFQPDAIVLALHTTPTTFVVDHLAAVVATGKRIPYPQLDSILRRRGISARLPWPELVGLIRIHASDLMAWSLRHIADESRRRGVVPIAIGIDQPGTPTTGLPAILAAARRAGFEVVDIHDVYGPPADHARLTVAPWDGHPNAAGHALIAERLLAELTRLPALADAFPPAPGGAAPTPSTARPTAP